MREFPDRLTLQKINIEDDPSLTKNWYITKVPTVVIINEDRTMRIEGARTYTELKDLVFED
jgi:predicted DsbA family dithiol-disulfide isomerase